MKAICIGGALAGLSAAAGRISGGCLNPAVGLIQTLGQNWFYNQHALHKRRLDDGSMLIYILGPLAGGLVAGLFAILNDSATKNFNEKGEEQNEGGDLEHTPLIKN